MKLMVKVNYFVFVLLLMVSGCTSTTHQNIDQSKAAKNRYELGLTYLNNGNFSKAKFNLDKALEFAPRSAQANAAMAYYYQTVGENEQAEKAYQFALDLEPSNAIIANSYGAFLCLNGDYQKAKGYFLKAVKTRSYTNSAETYERLAICSHNNGLTADAADYLRSAVNHQPGRASSLFLLTEVLVELKQWQEAKVSLRRYEKVAQINPQSLKLSIMIEQGLGNHETAQGYQQMLLTLFPNSAQAKSLLENTRQEQDNNSLVTAKSQATVVNTQPQKNNAQLLSSHEQENPQVQQEALNEPLIPQQTSNKNDHHQPEQQPSYHIVQRGDNLYRISVQYNIRMQRLMDWNNLDNESAIYQGMKLSLVAPKAVE